MKEIECKRVEIVTETFSFSDYRVEAVMHDGNLVRIAAYEGGGSNAMFVLSGTHGADCLVRLLSKVLERHAAPPTPEPKEKPE